MCTRGGCLPRFLCMVPRASAPGQYAGNCPSTCLASLVLGSVRSAASYRRRSLGFRWIRWEACSG
eukprot:3570836-Pyramimonas_sp.AAC.1